jgi:hypothetical protein
LRLALENLAALVAVRDGRVTRLPDRRPRWRVDGCDVGPGPFTWLAAPVRELIVVAPAECLPDGAQPVRITPAGTKVLEDRG